jgi:uncharacterized repeat protein (TIGR02543 family)
VNNGCPWVAQTIDGAANIAYFGIGNGSLNSLGPGTAAFTVRPNVRVNNSTTTRQYAIDAVSAWLTGDGLQVYHGRFPFTQDGLTCAWTAGALTIPQLGIPQTNPQSLSVTTQPGCQWTATTSGFLQVVESAATVFTGSGTLHYWINANPGPNPRSGTIQVGNITVPWTQAGTAGSVTVRVATNPAGQSILVDNATYTAPYTFQWVTGSSHTVGVSSPQGSGATRYVFASWSQGGAQNQTVTAAGNATYTANFSPQYQLTTTVSPVGGGTVNPASGEYYAPGTIVNLVAAAANGYTFTGWTGPVLSANSANTTILMNAPQSVTANFASDGQWTPQATAVLNYCLANPNNCSISINHITGGWRRDYHGTRLNVLASTFKVVPLIGYGEAVANGHLNPQTMVPRDQWAEFWTGQDGGALSNAWNRLGQPQNVSLDQMVGAMMRDSDNATADYLLDKLGAGAMKNVITTYFIDSAKERLPGPFYVDQPKSIGALFTSWMGTPANPLQGAANVTNYSGIEPFGYGLELDNLFTSLHDPKMVQAQRNFVCAAVPWQPAPSPCTFGSGITESVHRALTTGYFPKSNTRTYTELMTGLLERNLLPSQVQAVVEPHLEWWLSTATGQNFRRYGAKGGSLGTGLGSCSAPPNCLTVLTWTAYVETLQNAPRSSHGVQAVVTIQLRDPVLGSNALQALIPGVQHFADALVLDPVFAANVLTRLPDDPPLPDLISRITALGPDRAGPSGPTTIEVLNIGTAATSRSTLLALFLTGSSTPPPGATAVHTMVIPALRPGGSTSFTFSLGFGPYLISVVDPQDLIVESDKENNVQYEKLLNLR